MSVFGRCCIMSSSLLSNASLSLTGKVHLNEAVKMFDRDVLRELKREFGGLQTLLRNEHQVFQGVCVCVCGRCIWGLVNHCLYLFIKNLSCT